MAARLIGLDWGTSSLRAYLFDETGGVLDQRAAPLGIMQIRDRNFAGALADVAGEWIAVAPDLPALACGMIGSAQGWREVPYHRGPAGLGDLASKLSA
ncbi:MAG: 2-dehydro-3-deoxygalactonokinase, partial [Acetobacteraceae bacterium]|nr:2-dehydro-3-deoxygalactonokinase [Acetobacteraceae bacterium]